MIINEKEKVSKILKSWKLKNFKIIEKCGIVSSIVFEKFQIDFENNKFILKTTLSNHIISQVFIFEMNLLNTVTYDLNTRDIISIAFLNPNFSQSD